MLERYQQDIINFSQQEINNKGFISLLKSSVFPDPVYLCISGQKPFNTEFDDIKDYVLKNVSTYDQNSVKQVLGYTVIPVVFITNGDEVTALICSSDDRLSIIINEEDLTKVLDDINSRGYRRRR